MKWPHDRDAERAVIGNSLQSADWHERARQIVAPGDFFFTEHQVIVEALDELQDVGPFPPAVQPTWSDWEAMWPIVPPSSLGVRVGAVYAMGPTGAPLAALRRLAGMATGTVEKDAHTVHRKALERGEIQRHLERVDELTRVGR
ncbi:MAG: hypothetical protein M3Q68_05640 [Actinomycetota bacterium]|nr:hypothetical protein [Actinomycetota bacterium]